MNRLERELILNLFQADTICMAIEAVYFDTRGLTS